MLDLYGKPGEPFVLSTLTFGLLADRIRIVTTPVPEPGTIALLGCSLFALGWLGRGNRRHHT